MSLPELDGGLEALLVGDGEHAQESLAAAEVVVADGRVVLLAGRVEDVDLDLFAVEHDLVATKTQKIHILITFCCEILALEDG